MGLDSRGCSYVLELCTGLDSRGCPYILELCTWVWTPGALHMSWSSGSLARNKGYNNNGEVALCITLKYVAIFVTLSLGK